ncbi:MAG TPA: cytochrome c [Longimicrobiales bacterium]|nr:cytochrome c [Longimicrobiales bacterium]
MRRLPAAIAAAVIFVLPLSAAAQQADANGLPPGIGPAQIDAGAAIFRGRGNCFVCHGASGEGTMLGPALKGGEWLHIKGGFEEIVALVRSGVPKPVKFPAPMPEMGGAKLSDEELRAVAAYVWTLSRTGDGGAGGGS